MEDEMRLLVVEDEKDLNSIIVKNLEAEGYIVDSCYDGEDAVIYMTTIDYDAVILDVMIPKMSGFEVLKKVREMKIETPVLFLTARDHVDDIVFGLNIGADDYMVKPFSFDELMARLRVIVRRKPEVRGGGILQCAEPGGPPADGAFPLGETVRVR